MNLLLNAAEALPEGNATGEWVTFATRDDGDDVLVSVEDTVREALAPVIQRLDELEPLLVRTSARAAAGDEVLGEGARRRREIARERSPILVVDCPGTRSISTTETPSASTISWPTTSARL